MDHVFLIVQTNWNASFFFSFIIFHFRLAFILWTLFSNLKAASSLLSMKSDILATFKFTQKTVKLSTTDISEVWPKNETKQSRHTTTFSCLLILSSWFSNSSFHKISQYTHIMTCLCDGLSARHNRDSRSVTHNCNFFVSMSGSAVELVLALTLLLLLFLVYSPCRFIYMFRDRMWLLM